MTSANSFHCAHLHLNCLLLVVCLAFIILLCMHADQGSTGFAFCVTLSFSTQLLHITILLQCLGNLRRKVDELASHVSLVFSTLNFDGISGHTNVLYKHLAYFLSQRGIFLMVVLA